MLNQKNYDMLDMLRIAADTCHLDIFDDKLAQQIHQYDEELSLSEEELSLVAAGTRPQVPPLFKKQNI
ncbi:MAG: hypothetical protein IKV59_09900 [Lachnospiraceae bacterium]|nr:hypothetical protein [Lachnospiraceae bacterium]